VTKAVASETEAKTEAAGSETEAKTEAAGFETEAEAVKTLPRGCLETRQCLEAPQHCLE